MRSLIRDEARRTAVNFAKLPDFATTATLLGLSAGNFCSQFTGATAPIRIARFQRNITVVRIVVRIPKGHHEID